MPISWCGAAISSLRRIYRFEFSNAQSDLKIANTKLHALNEFTRAKKLTELDAKVKTCDAKLKSDEAKLALEKQKLTVLERKSPAASSMLQPPARSFTTTNKTTGAAPSIKSNRAP